VALGAAEQMFGRFPTDARVISTTAMGPFSLFAADVDDANLRFNFKNCSQQQTIKDATSLPRKKNSEKACSPLLAF